MEMNSTGYSGGRIIRISLQNFMTYTKLTMKPTEGLNLIIGPNGSGKSSIVCAICLGLAGKPTFTGRNIRLQEFIAHGCDYARIEIELDDANSPHNTVIRRQIKRDGKSLFYLNGRQVREQEIEREARRFNIQVNNLCQFLPQERVAAFARMNSKELLESMQQAVGDQEMFANYKLLLKMQVDKCELDKKCKALHEYIEKEKSRNSDLEPEVQVFEQRESYKKRLAELQKLLPVRQYHENFILFNALKQKRSKIEEELQKLQNLLEPKQMEIDLLQKGVAEVETKTTLLMTSMGKLIKVIERTSGDVNKTEEKINEAKLDFENMKRQAEEQISKAQNLRKQIVHQELEYIKCKQIVDSKKESVEEAKAKKNELLDELSTIQAHRSSLALNKSQADKNLRSIERELATMNSLEHKKMQSLLQRDKHTYEALMWLKENRSLFKKRVYEPILTLIEISSASKAKFLENHIKFRDMTVFLCEDSDDAKKFARILRQEKGLAINVASVPSHPSSWYKPQLPLSELRRCHFTCYLRDLFKAPDAVVAYLCDLYIIHNTPCGDDKTELYLQSAEEDPPFRVYYTPQFRYTSIRSIYGDRLMSTNSSAIREKKWLFPSDDGTEEQRKIRIARHELIKKEIQDIVNKDTQLYKREASIKITVDRLREIENDFRERQEGMTQCWKNIAQKRKTLHICETNKIDLVEGESKMKSLIDSYRDVRKSDLQNLQSVTKELVVMASTRTKYQLKIMVRRHKLREMQKKCDHEQSVVKEKENEFHEITERYKAMKRNIKETLEKAQQACGMEISERNRKKLAKMLKSLPESVQEMEAEMNRLKAILNCMSDSNQESFEEYERRKFSIQESENDYKKLKNELTQLNAEVGKKKLEWLEPLQDLVDKISNTFSKYFERLGCAGEVVISKGDDTDNFDQYGLSLRVKFRHNVPLIELSQSHHSGGECSVSTILFILSLQELTEVPFRCIDEINQGMDSVNERQVFSLVAESAAKSSQYFLLTPKLLPGLEYSEKMTIHIIHNSPTMDFENWDISHFRKSRRAIN